MESVVSGTVVITPFSAARFAICAFSLGVKTEEKVQRQQWTIQCSRKTSVLTVEL